MTADKNPGPLLSPEAGARGSPLTVSWLYSIIVLALLATFMVSIRSALSPLVLLLLFLYVSWPLLGSRLYARIVAATIAVSLLWILKATGFLLSPFILALVFAYILDPAIDGLSRKGVPRTVSILLLSLPIIAAIAVLVLVLFPAVVRQISQLVGNVPAYLDSVQGWLIAVRAWLIGLGIPGVTDQSVPGIRQIDDAAVAEYLSVRQAALAESGWNAVLGLSRGIGTVLIVMGYLFLTPIVTFFLLRDWDRLVVRAAELVPNDLRPQVVRFASEYDRLLSRYLRGQLLLSILVGLFIGIGFRIAGFPYSLLIGLTAGTLNLIPYAGFVTSLALSLIIALFSGAILSSLLTILVVFGLEQVFESIVQPLIVGRSVDLHPVWLLLALALASFFFGFVGLLLAAPIAVLVKLIVNRLVARYRSSRYYAEHEAA
ncbi:MAG: AI-2E family transporter [Gemmatimonadota bacterium]